MAIIKNFLYLSYLYIYSHSICNMLCILYIYLYIYIYIFSYIIYYMYVICMLYLYYMYIKLFIYYSKWMIIWSRLGIRLPCIGGGGKRRKIIRGRRGLLILLVGFGRIEKGKSRKINFSQLKKKRKRKNIIMRNTNKKYILMICSCKYKLLHFIRQMLKSGSLNILPMLPSIRNRINKNRLSLSSRVKICFLGNTFQLLRRLKIKKNKKRNVRI